MKLITICLFALLMASCDETPGEAYQRGFDEGMEAVCGEIIYKYPEMRSRLQRDGLC